MSKFTDVLKEYLDERDRQKNGYYNDRWVEARVNGQYLLRDLEKQLNEMIHGVENDEL